MHCCSGWHEIFRSVSTTHSQSPRLSSCTERYLDVDYDLLY